MNAVHVCQRQAEELLLVPPFKLALGEPAGL